MLQSHYKRATNLVIATLIIHGCASTSPSVKSEYVDCDLHEGTVVFSEMFVANGDEQSIAFDAAGGDEVCFTMRRLDRQNVPAPEDGGVRVSIGPDDRVAALVGGTTLEIEYAADEWREDQVSFSTQVPPGVEQQFKFQSQDVDVLIEGIRRSFPPIPDDVPPDQPGDDGPGVGGGGARTTIDVPEVVCTGRLMGFENPMRFEHPELASHGRPEIHRMARVGCAAYWRVHYTFGPSELHKVTAPHEEAGFFTDAEGSYSATVPASTIQVRTSGPVDAVLERVEPHCVPAELCGHEFRPDPEAPLANIPLDAVASGENEANVDIVDVLDLVSDGHQAAGFQTLLGARLISKGRTHPERNNKPFIIHEQLDVHNEENTEFVVWGFSGQPVRKNFWDPEQLESRRVDPRYEPCEFNNRQICLPFTENCSPALCSSDDYSCLEEGILQVLLDNGYDVWIVDHLKGDADITHMAAAAPLLYQQILNFGGPLGSSGLIVPIPFPMDEFNQTIATAAVSEQRERERFMRSLVAEGRVLTREIAGEFFNRNALPLPPVATEPQSGDRRAIVAGYSMGGVLARIALRLWETRDDFPHVFIKDQDDREIVVTTKSSVFMEEPGDKIALYVSLDAPHQGARVPTAVQAHLFRLEYMLNNTPGISYTARAQADRAIFEISSPPSRQLLQQSIDSNLKYDPLGCLRPNSLFKKVTNCTVTSWESDVTDRLTTQDSTLFEGRWAAAISELSPQSRHGLPATIPAIAFSNGTLASTREVSSQRVANIDWYINNFPDKTHRLCDEADGLSATGSCSSDAGLQPEGAQWNSICRRITSQNIYYEAADLIVTGVELKRVGIDYDMRARFDGQQPVPNTGFPTLIPTKSALIQDNNGAVSTAWMDAHWQPQSQYHTNFDNEMCKVLMFHSDKALGLDEDGDGWPACGTGVSNDRCSLGGRRPGLLMEPDVTADGGSWCDCAPNDPNVHPGAGC